MYFHLLNIFTKELCNIVAVIFHLVFEDIYTNGVYRKNTILEAAIIIINVSIPRTHLPSVYDNAISLLVSQIMCFYC